MIVGKCQKINLLKEIRLAAENSEGLVEDSKKMILNLVDQAIIFHEAEVQARMQAETLKQAVLMASERIKKIEDELDDSLSLPENVVTTASGMKSGKREQQLRTPKKTASSPKMLKSWPPTCLRSFKSSMIFRSNWEKCLNRPLPKKPKFAINWSTSKPG
ncbi:MAG: hypothetical protein GY850_33425 [bacterium]|nr:hypothetical protein [bacterium]